MPPTPTPGLLIELDAILAVVLGGTSLPGGKFSLAGTVVGVARHPDADSHDPLPRRPLGGQLALQGGRRHRGVPRSSRRGARALAARAPAGRARAAPRPREGRSHRMSDRAPPPPPRRAWDRASGPSAPPDALPARSSPRSALFLVLLPRRRCATTDFTDPQVIISLLLDNAFLLVLAVGMTFVILTGGIDLSVGSVVALSTMIARQDCSSRAGRRTSSIVAVLVAGTLARAAHRRAGPVLRRPAVHRLAGRAVPGPRAPLRDQRRVDPDHGPHVHRAGFSDRSRSATGTSRSTGDHRARPSPSRRSSWTAPGSAAPSTRSAATSSRPG